MTKERAVCFYHDLRADFDEALTLARHNSCLQCPSPLLKRTAMAVCSCRRYSEHRSSKEQLQLFLLDQAYSDAAVSTESLNPACLEDSTFSEITNTGSGVMDMCVAMAKTGNESALRFLCLAKMGQTGDFRLLEEELVFSSRKSWHGTLGSVSTSLVSVAGMKQCSKDGAKSESTDSTLKEGESHSKLDKDGQNLCHRSRKKRYFDPANMKYILRKRKRQAGFSSCLHLPMFGGNVTNLQADPSIGHHFQTVSRRFKPCVIQVRYAETGQLMMNNACKTVLSVWCKKQDARDVHSFLYKKAEEIQTAITTRWKQRPAAVINFNPRSQLSRVDQDKDYEIFDDPQTRKETRWNDFGKKRFADQRDKQRKGRHGVKAFYRCYNCLAEKTSAGDRSCSKMCKFHPGFLHDQRWTCCGHSHVGQNHVGQSHVGQNHVGQSHVGQSPVRQNHVVQNHEGRNHGTQEHVSQNQEGQGHIEPGMSIRDHHKAHGCVAVERHDWKCQQRGGHKLPKDASGFGSTLYFPTTRKGRRRF